MTLKLDFLEAEKKAESLTQGLTELPICPFAIALANDITVEPKDSDESGVSGFLTRVGNNFGIGYSTHIRNEGFIHFTIAHELGHYFLPGHPDKLFSGGNQIHKSHSGFVSDDICEKQADYFAKSLLMPESLFLTALRMVGEGFAAIDSLATKCKTSITATAIRFAQIAEDPVAVIMSSGNKVEWCFVSDALANCKSLRWLKKGSLIPQDSATAQLNRNQANVLRGKKAEAWTRLDYWFDEGLQIEMKEDVVGLGHYGKTLTVLFTNEAIDCEDDDNYLEIGNEDKGWKWK